VTPSPAVFDFDKLNWLNRHYLKQASLDRLAALAWPYFADRIGGAGAGQAARALQPTPVLPPGNEPEMHATEVLPSGMMGTTEDRTGFREVAFAEGAALSAGAAFATGAGPSAPDTAASSVAQDVPAVILPWFERLLALLVPSVDHLDQLPAKATPVFGVDPLIARANEENAAILAADSSHTVLTQLANRAHAHIGPVTPEVFNAWLNEIKIATGIKGKDLFNPVRIAITGAPSGPLFEKLIPLIEEGAALGLSIRTLRERIDRFVGA
jgi:glutamyl/glutaminyl-tRNA synthetase